MRNTTRHLRIVIGLIATTACGGGTTSPSLGPPVIAAVNGATLPSGPTGSTVIIEGQNFGIVQTSGYSGSFLYTFTPLLSGNAQVAYTTNSSTGVGNNSSSPDSNTLTAGAGLNWRILRWLSSTLQYTYTLQSSSGNSTNGNGTVNANGTVTGNGNVTVNTVTFSLVGSF